MRNQTILVDINKETCKILKYKQYDNNNILQIIVEENYKKINLNEYVGFAFFELPSGLIIKKKCEIEDNVITIIIDNNVLSEEGKVLLDLTLSDGEDIFTLFRINLVIEETIDRDEAIIIEAGWDIVAEIAKFDKAEEQRVANEERRVDYESVRIANESDRQNEETKRIANENVRIVKENERLSKEIERQNAEELRIENEEGRVGAEVSRVTAEQNRVTAEQNRIARFNEMEDVVSRIDVDITELQNDVDVLQNDITEIQNDVDVLQNDITEIQNDMANAQTQTFTVTDAYKFTVDHDEMMSSLLTLNNIEGLSSIETNTSNQKRLVTTKLHDICTINTSKNYFEDAVFSSVGNNAQYSKEGNNVRVWGSNNAGYMLVTFTIPTLVEGKTYCIICDNVVVTSGSPAIQVPGINLGLDQSMNGYDMEVSGLNGIFRSVDNASMLIHCGVQQQTGDVTYENIQIYEVKEMIVPDIQLNSLPNGVKDEIKDGMLIKRTNHVNLAELTWVPSVTNSQFPQSDFVVYYTRDISDIIVDPNAWTNELGHILCNNIPSVPNIGTNSAEPSAAENNKVGISGHREKSELRIKLYRSGVPDLTALYAWLTTNNVHAVYQLATPEYIPVGLTIKADKSDTVVINTTKTMDLTYDIQLNTRGQIDALQEQSQIQQSDISMLQQHANNIQNDVRSMSWLTDIGQDDTADKNYYILPGGLMIQYGRVLFQPNTIDTTYDFSIQLPKPCNARNSVFICSLSGADNGWDGICAGHFTSPSFVRVVLRGVNNTVLNTLFWIALSATN